MVMRTSDIVTLLLILFVIGLGCVVYTIRHRDGPVVQPQSMKP